MSQVQLTTQAAQSLQRPSKGPATQPAADADAPPAGLPSIHCYAAAIENRAKEVGIAILDVNSLTLKITQHIEPGRCAHVLCRALFVVAACCVGSGQSTTCYRTLDWLRHRCIHQICARAHLNLLSSLPLPGTGAYKHTGSTPQHSCCWTPARHSRW